MVSIEGEYIKKEGYEGLWWSLFIQTQTTKIEIVVPALSSRLAATRSTVLLQVFFFSIFVLLQVFFRGC